ncbi:radical SAM protein [Muribaculum gordoncarteri]|jgi:uncharacterized protein|uniref:Radical SAM protein n=10 Tax=Muribaculum TaxID=1918540 RepID=A0A4P7VQJ1_9BACT|nr:radical SAM protein [Muribaculum gordoncarteri]QCD36551.1 radical SAM protein [Muribaculum gordoncarteri]
MKPSHYNYILSKDSKSYWYNGVSHKFFTLPIELGNKIKPLICNPEILKESAPSFYQKLVDNEFIIDDNVDEIEVIRKRNLETIHSKDYFLVILPTLNCNYKCWYCIQNHIPSMMSQETITRVKKHIDYMIDERNITSLHIEWFGGEPFMYFKQVIAPISEYAIEKCDKAKIPFLNSATTNGYFLSSDKIKDLKRLKFSGFQITLDGDKGNHDKVKFQNGCDSAFVHTLGNIDKILSALKDMNIVLRINYTHKTLTNKIVSQINEYISPENRKQLTITPKKVWQESVDKNFQLSTISILDEFNDYGYNAARMEIVDNFVPCYANREYYNAINYNGGVVKCTACNDLYESNPPGQLQEDGKIEWKNNFDKLYQEKSYENPKCLNCKYLPVCMGICPRDHAKKRNYCKMDAQDSNIETSLIDFIEHCK